MNLNPSEKNAFVALEQLLKLTKVKVTSTTLKNKLLQHPDFPTLVSLSDVLTDVKVDNMATRINPYQLAEIPLPAIAHFEDGTGYITVHKIADNQVEWFHNQMGIRRESIAEFSQKWQGITLLAQPNANSGEDNYSKNRRFEIIEKSRNPFIISGLLLILGYSIWNNFMDLSIENPNSFYAFLIAKFAGVMVSSFLIWYSIDANNSFLKSVCEINSKTNCGNILNSEAAKIFGWLTWSEIGLFYFTGGFLALVFSNNLTETLLILKWLNVLALPYTVWSIYYQAFVAKEWCVLCLSVQLLLWVEFFTLSQISFSLNSEMVDSFINLSFCFLSVTILWAFIKKPLQNSERFGEVYNTLQKIKFDPDYVKGLLSKERMLPPIFEGMRVLKMGNPDAEHTILAVLNPVCNSCKVKFESLVNLTQRNTTINCNIILVSYSLRDEKGIKIIGKIFNAKDKQAVNVLRDWFAKKWDVLKELKENEESFFELQKNLIWIQLSGVIHTPTIFLNNFELPRIYSVDDIETIYKNFQTNGFANQK